MPCPSNIYCYVVRKRSGATINLNDNNDDVDGGQTMEHELSKDWQPVPNLTSTDNNLVYIIVPETDGKEYFRWFVL